MNYEMFMQIMKVLKGIRDELHAQNIINSEQNMILEYSMPVDVNPSCDLLPYTRGFLNNNAKGASNG